jgi:uncharacterized protein (DUF1015 family)
MPDIQALHGLRYDLGHVGSLSDVVAPPYDVISPELQSALYKRHPANVVRLILNREEPGDDAHNNRYLRAARFLKNWRKEGVLQSEPQAALYVYHQAFDYHGRRLTRRGFMARVRLQPFGQGNIYPHEETHAAAKADRLKLTQACRANLSQIFGLYPDPDNTAQEILEAAVAGHTPIEATDHLDVLHRMWPVTDVKTITDVAAAMGPLPLFIADGHHRYETACNYRDQLAQSESLDVEHPANYVLTMCVSMNDAGMVVLPTHRLFRGLPAMTGPQLRQRLGDSFDSRVAGQGVEQAQVLWQQIESQQLQHTLGFFTSADQQWTIAALTDLGQQRLRQVASDKSDPWRSLGVSLLQRLVIEHLLQAGPLPEPKYVHLISELVEALQQGDTDRSAFPLATLVMPATLDHIQSISQRGERMPAKSTYFYPKLLSGLVINPLE